MPQRNRTDIGGRTQHCELLAQFVAIPLAVHHIESASSYSPYDHSTKRGGETTNLCSITRRTRSMMFCGHAFLKIAPRFSGTGALGSFVFLCLFAAGFFTGGESSTMGLFDEPATGGYFAA